MSSNVIKLKWEPRKEQILILEKFKKVIEQKKKFFVVEAPVGSGKSFAITMMSDYYQKNVQKTAKFDILTNTKLLQSQYLRDFDFIKSFQGKDNYRCDKYNCSCSEGMKLNELFEIKCNYCPYQIAKVNYQESHIGLLNFHLFMSFETYAEDFLKNRNANILFIDEAHLFEEIYCSFVDSFISIPYIASLGVTITVEIKEEFKAIKTKEDFAKFLGKNVVPVIRIKMEQLEQEVKTVQLLNSSKIEKMKEFRKISRTKCKYGRFLRDEKNWADNWIIEFGEDTNGEKFCKVEAIWGKSYLSEIWEKYDMVVMLSGTILDKLFFTNLMGMDLSSVSFLSIDSPFPVKNRQINFLDTGKMSFDILEESFNKAIPEIKKILEKHKNEKGIIHTGNYKLASWIKREIKNDRLLFHDTDSKEQVLNQHVETDRKTVLVSPSMINGVDLKDDLSRFQIILKIPFPALDTEKTKKRMQQNKRWYHWKTLCDLIQSTGRSIRSEEDYATTYIIDSNFEILVNRLKLPNYIEESIVYN